jgi:hypothetical protein
MLAHFILFCGVGLTEIRWTFQLDHEALHDAMDRSVHITSGSATIHPGIQSGSVSVIVC